MRSLTRAVRLAPLFAALLLGGCVTAETVSVDTTATAVPVATRGPDEPRDDLTLGKEHFRARHYGLAEMHFRRAVESRKDDAEAWLGLAASYDELKRYRLADRAPTPEFLNNRGYSYLLRGDLRRASQDLSEAQAKDPENEKIRNNLKTLDVRARGRG